jgi:hypothetical protein
MKEDIKQYCSNGSSRTGWVFRFLLRITVYAESPINVGFWKKEQI